MCHKGGVRSRKAEHQYRYSWKGIRKRRELSEDQVKLRFLLSAISEIACCLEPRL
jgi:hypothetical protein